MKATVPDDEGLRERDEREEVAADADAEGAAESGRGLGV